MRNRSKMAENESFEEKQDPEERRQIRMRYRNFIHELQENKEDLINPESDQLQERLKEADELFRPVQMAREAVLDSKAMSIIADLGRMKAQALHTEFVRFQPTEFAEKLKAFVDGRSAQPEGSVVSKRGWAQLGKATQPYYRRAPIFSFIYGTFERGPKPVKERQKANRVKDNVVGKETVPTQLKNFAEQENSEATTEEVERVYDILKEIYEKEEGNELCFFEFVVNPKSFGHTVENIFHVSFLIRDGLAEIKLDDDDLPVIRPIDNKEKEANQGQRDTQRHQSVISITPKDWKELVEVFNVQSAIIPPHSQLVAGTTNGNS